MTKQPPLEIKVGPRKITYGEFQKFISSLPIKSRGKATVHASHFLRQRFYESDYTQPYKYASRKMAYGNYRGHDGRGWKISGSSPSGITYSRQRAWFFWSVKNGRIPGWSFSGGKISHDGQPHRSGAIANGWEVTGKGVDTRIVNSAPGAVWVHDNKFQARQPALAGWTRLDDLIEENIDDAIEDTAYFIVMDFKRELSKW